MFTNLCINIYMNAMKTENISSFFEHIFHKLNPSDLLHGEHRLAVADRVEHLLKETGLTRQQFGERIRTELHSVRDFLSGTRDMTLETLTEICSLLHISLGDLVIEHA
ncbi:Cro/C1-type helix-turn-helix DNA-binding protein [Mucilaginibacter yixingensis]|uniref:Cro/C1-type helix-turn-helix DNA-binding protein n=2 Tax=Mucilaginibacter yixingensis TaxID=1295612 RepID=A0A2T5J5K1_9SPHI|nr:Cro/C1-type helix-turn-helix DNA-binding protein [Mucilaginibacter yixingensis]